MEISTVLSATERNSTVPGRLVRSIRVMAGLLTAPLAAAVVLAAGCGDGSFLDPGAADPELLRSRAWVLVAIQGADGTVRPVTGVDASPPRVDFTGEPRNQGLRFGGHGGCNQMGGTYHADRDGDLEILELAATEKACFPERIMEVESAFFQALAAAESYRVRPDRLVVGFDGGEIRMEAEAR